MCEIIGRIYGIGSVNVSMNRISHMARSSIETVYEYSKLKNYNAFVGVCGLGTRLGVIIV